MTNNKLKNICLILILIFSWGVSTESFHFKRECEKAKLLPCYEGLPNGPDDDNIPFIMPSRYDSFSEVERIIDAASLQRRELLFQAKNWILDGDFGAERARISLGQGAQRAYEDKVALPFVQRVLLPVGSSVAVFGDLHGAYHSLLRSLGSLIDQGFLDENLTVKSEHSSDFFMVFLGDYVDRGLYGLETLLTLMELRLASPNNVFLSRGNHEDLVLNDGPSGGFLYELRSKFPNEKRIEKVFDLYNSLPSAIFLGVFSNDEKKTVSEKETNHHPVLLCCHGGIEVGAEVLPLLSAPTQDALPSGAFSHFSLIHGLYRGQWLNAIPKQLFKKVKRGINSPERIFKDIGSCPSRKEEEGHGSIINPSSEWSSGQWPLHPTDVHPHLGFMWADFLVGDERIKSQSEWNVGKAAALGKAIIDQPGRGLAYGSELTEHWLKSSGIVGILRAHQHNDAAETGPMLRSLKRSKTPGIFDNFNRSHKVVTFLSGALIPGQGFQFDAYGLLHLSKEDPSTWSLDACASSRVDAAVCGTSGTFTCQQTDWTVFDFSEEIETSKIICSRKNENNEL